MSSGSEKNKFTAIFSLLLTCSFVRSFAVAIHFIYGFFFLYFFSYSFILPFFHSSTSSFLLLLYYFSCLLLYLRVYHNISMLEFLFLIQLNIIVLLKRHEISSSFIFLCFVIVLNGNRKNGTDTKRGWNSHRRLDMR